MAVLFTAGCGEYGTAPPASEQEPTGLLSSSTASNVIVNTTSDVADFEGGQQVSDLPGPDGQVSLREAITAANNTTGGQIVGFNIPLSDPGFASGVFTIRPTSELPTLSDDGTSINGATQRSFTGNTNPNGPEVAINGGQLGNPVGGNGLTIRSANNRVHSLVINGFRVEGCCDGGNGILIDGIGAAGNVVTGCYLGTDASGSVAIANDNTGVTISGGATNNRVGGTDPEQRNVLSGNTGVGITLTAEANLVLGNFIGTDRTGRVALGNGGAGVAVDIDGDNNTIGGPSAGARNIISGNGRFGVSINGTGRPLGNTVEGNLIGTDVTGRVALGNGEDGISIVSDLFEPGGPRPANNNRIFANLVSANGRNGISAGSDNNRLLGNLIGTDITGMVALGNGEDGISIGGSDNRVLRNLVAASGRTGIILFGVDNTVIRSNLIGTNIRGEITPGFGSAEYGISVGSTEGRPTSNGTQVGGREADQGNLIAGNQANGVLIQAGVRNSILRNRIFSNGVEGIDLGQDGVTPNDPGDADTGPNNLMNFPVLTGARTSSEQLTVRGTIDTPNPSSVTIEFFANPVPTPGGDPSGHGEGAVFLGRARPNAQGNFTAELPGVRRGTLISATATDADGNTSEFSLNLASQ